MINDALAMVGVIGDIHAEDERLAAAIAFLRGAGVERILAVGDIVDGPGDPDRCCRLLEESDALVVRGNHDRWLLEGAMRDLPDAHRPADLSVASQRFLGSLPTTRLVATISGSALLCHGLLDNDMRRLTSDDDGYELQCNDELQTLLARRDVTFVINGHTHRRMARRFGHVTILNAGTLCPADDPCVMVVDFARRNVRFHDVLADMSVGEGRGLDFP